MTTAVFRLLVVASTGWAILIPFASFAASQPAPAPFLYGAALLVYGAGSVVCHQLAERSFQLWSAQLPVCARCTGIYAGVAMTALVAAMRPGAFRPRTVGLKPDSTWVTHVRSVKPYVTNAMALVLALAALPTASTLLYEWATSHTPSNVLRAVSGLPLGAALGGIVIGAFASSSPDRSPLARSGSSAVRP
jgi:uncharacterized membrane protein